MPAYKKLIWHRHLILLDCIEFRRDPVPVIVICSVVLRRWSRSDECWIYARPGQYKIGDLSR